MTEPRLSTQNTSRGGEPTSASSAEASLDPDVVDSLRRLGTRSGRNVLRELTELFLSSADAQVATAQQLLGRDDLIELARVAHGLKGSASVIGGRRASAAAAALESACLAAPGGGSTEEYVRAALTHLLGELELLRGAVRELTAQS